jgi:hypothetical protein
MSGQLRFSPAQIQALTAVQLCGCVLERQLARFFHYKKTSQLLSDAELTQKLASPLCLDARKKMEVLVKTEQVVRIVCPAPRPTLPSREPVVSWTPGQSTPNLSSAASKLFRRWGYYLLGPFPPGFIKATRGRPFPRHAFCTPCFAIPRSHIVERLGSSSTLAVRDFYVSWCWWFTAAELLLMHTEQLLGDSPVELWSPLSPESNERATHRLTRVPDVFNSGFELCIRVERLRPTPQVVRHVVFGWPLGTMGRSMLRQLHEVSESKMLSYAAY